MDGVPKELDDPSAPGRVLNRGMDQNWSIRNDGIECIEIIRIITEGMPVACILHANLRHGSDWSTGAAWEHEHAEHRGQRCRKSNWHRIIWHCVWWASARPLGCSEENYLPRSWPDL